MGNKRQSSGQQHRVFFALPIDSATSAKLDVWRRVMPITGRMVPTANFHLTLAFIGEVDGSRLDALMDSRFDGYPPFLLEFGELAYFARAKVLSIAPCAVPEALSRLAARCQQLAQHWGNARKEHNYQPHITLARDVEPPVPPASDQMNLSLRCSMVQLLESRPAKQGVYYEVLAEWPLQRPLRPQPR